MTKKLPTIKCPSCGMDITRDDLKYCQTGTMFYKVWFDKKGEPNYEEDEFDNGENGEFFHADCGGESIDYKDLKKLKVNY